MAQNRKHVLREGFFTLNPEYHATVHSLQRQCWGGDVQSQRRSFRHQEGRPNRATGLRKNLLSRAQGGGILGEH